MIDILLLLYAFSLGFVLKTLMVQKYIWFEGWRREPFVEFCSTILAITVAPLCFIYGLYYDIKRND